MKKKNILAENMRRFGTKNLSEQLSAGTGNELLNKMRSLPKSRGISPNGLQTIYRFWATPEMSEKRPEVWGQIINVEISSNNSVKLHLDKYETPWPFKSGYRLLEFNPNDTNSNGGFYVPQHKKYVYNTELSNFLQQEI